MLRNKDTGNIVTENDVLAQHKNTSFPLQKTEELWNSLGYDLVFEGAYPTFDPNKETIEPDGTEQKTENGKKVWYTKHKVVDKFADIEGGKTKEQQEADHLASIDVNTAMSNRNKRNILLSETDWWASSDLTMSSEQIQYRKDLRDITTHSSWPNLKDSDWPTKP